ncbi:hypothetical protein CYMTET_24745 [Cymbomonas tetramitiformis]|uniref:Exonuclease domain-containing protein n=1 Tax=Cymbomonas tetramitiformis TaxID=36881 RepID=A0AAE0KZX8_9CHLO|nr:hypothetical protein CYMTET_24745 [Cymbomonas tetramitiformis]
MPSSPSAPSPRSGAPSPGAPSPPVRVAPPQGPIFSIDVECIATDATHNGRAVAQIALVDAASNCLLNLYIKPTQPIFSYLHDLTGLTQEVIEEHGTSLEEAMRTLRAALPTNACLVGQNIRMDVEWLGLIEGQDFGSCIDLAGLFRVWNSRYSSYTYFGLDHLSTCWLGDANDGKAHNAVTDAQKSVRLFHARSALDDDPAQLQQQLTLLLNTPRTPSFAVRNPTYDNVCMGNRKTCTCGAAFFG